MSDQPFVHLHVHTEYSLLDGFSRIKPLIKRATQLGMTALAITDHGTMHGVIDFYRACKDAKINPIIGVEAYLAPNRMTDRDPRLDKKAMHLLLLAKSETGYKNLLKIATAGQLEGFYRRPRIDRDFLAAHADGLIATSGCLAAEIPGLISDGREDDARAAIDWYLQVFGKGNFYLELQDHDIPELESVNRWLIDVGRRDDVPLLATTDVHYVMKEHSDLHDTLLCIQAGGNKSDEKRMRMSGTRYHLTAADEMWSLFGHIRDGEALLSTVAVAEMCALNLDHEGYHLPVFPVPPGHDAQSYMRYLCEKGLAWRYRGEADRADLRERLAYELHVINDMGFDTYFLIVWDLCEFARSRDIWWNVRGSGAGSLAAYCLGITNIDPIQNSLIFERFLNPGRKTMPDIDMDFPDDRRAELISYTANKYGEDKVAAIITFGTMGARAAINDVGRVLGVDRSLVNQATRLIPGDPKSTSKPICDHIEELADLKALYTTQPQIRQILDVANEMQGITRHVSTHAAGVIIGDRPLVEYLPLQRQTKDSGSGGGGADDNDDQGERGSGGANTLRQVTQFPMETCESIGLLKVDFLGLSTLTYLRRACDLVKKHHGIHYDMDTIPYRPTGEDADRDRMLRETFVMLGRGETIGVFQLESTGMQTMLREMKPTTFEHIIAGVSLYRPGPMEYISDYNDRMNGRKPVELKHPKLEPILAETYGIIVYQEQIMQIGQQLFGYTLSEADLMRRAVSKKKAEALAEHRQKFVDQGPAHGVDPASAEKIFADIAFFANYGFNKSHAADYAVLTVQTAFMKCHYPEEYMAALLSTYFDNSVRVTTLLAECRRLNIPLLPPDVNYSQLDFDIQTLDDGGRGIRFGLAAIKNAGVGATQLIIDAREAGGRFTDLVDFCQRIDLRRMGKRVLEVLIKVGALSAFGTRPQLLAALDRLVNFSTAYYSAQATGQMGLFGETTTASSSDDLLKNLPQVPEADVREMLNWEKELTGIYISSHPLDRILDQLAKANLPTIEDLKDPQSVYHRQDRGVRLVVLVTGIRRVITKNKDAMGIVALEDKTGAIECVFFPRTWAQVEASVKEGGVIVISGKVDLARGELQLKGETVSVDIPIMEADNDRSDPMENAYLPKRHPASASVTSDASAMPPTFDELPPILPDEDWTTPLMSLPDSSVVSAPRLLRIHFAPSDDEQRDRRRLDKLMGKLHEYPGTDRYEIVVVDADHEPLYLWEFPDKTTDAHPDLIAFIRRVAGVVNIGIIDSPDDAVSEDGYNHQSA